MNEQQGNVAHKPTGNVYRIESGQFGIVRYCGGSCKIYIALLESDSVTSAIKALEKKRPDWRFIHADSDTVAWGKIHLRAQGSAELI